MSLAGVVNTPGFAGFGDHKSMDHWQFELVENIVPWLTLQYQGWWFVQEDDESFDNVNVKIEFSWSMATRGVLYIIDLQLED